jgi:ligand-binding SRPBCC domain-containing protein
MPVIKLATLIAAPIERVFDLARSIDLHVDCTRRTGERAVAGVTSGLIGPGQEVTWRARHLGIWQSLTVRITVVERLTHFADVMVRGAFSRMKHQHNFEACADGTIMRDLFAYHAPVGVLGSIADFLFLKRYMQSLLMERNRVIKQTAELDAWMQYLEMFT